MVGRVSIQLPKPQPSVIIAAANSSAHAKRAADFVCDGTDDQEQIQAAIDRASDERGRVLLLGGDFLVRGTINLESNVTLEGVGPDSVIRLADGYSLDQHTWRARVHTPILLANGKENVTVRNLRVTGNTTQYEARAQVGIAFHDCDHCLADECHADAINYFPADVTNASNGGYGIGTFESRHITIRGGRYEGSGYENLRVDFKSKHILIDGVFCGGGNRTSLQIITGSKHVRIVNSAIIQDDPNAWSTLTIHAGIPSAGGEAVEDVLVEGCTIIGTLADGQDNGINIFTDGPTPKDIRFSRNYIACNKTAIRCRGERTKYRENVIVSDQIGIDATRATITGNAILCGTSGVRISAVGTSLTVVGIVIKNNAIIAVAKGVIAISAINGATITNNVMSCGESAIRISDTGSPLAVAGLKITGNTMDSAASPVLSLTNVTSGAGFVLSDNLVRSSVSAGLGINVFSSSIPRAICRGNRVATLGAGIRIASTASGSTGWVIAENDVTESGGIVLDTGTHRLRDNPGHVTASNGSATIASGNTSIVVTHGLARTPALKDISVTPTNGLGDATKFWISAATATQFTINVDANPGATTATFAWSAEIKP